MKVNRRKLLQSGAALAGVAIIRPAFEIFAAERFAEPAKSRFALPLRIPPTLHPIRRDETTDFYHITQKEAYAEILPGKKTKIWDMKGCFRDRRSGHREAARLWFAIPTGYPFTP
jgi:hypothetical protein